MFPLLDLYIDVSDEIRVEKYNEILNDFEKMWGMHVHVFSDNLDRFKNLDKFIDIINEKNITYSFGNGILCNEFNYFNIDKITQKLGKNFTSLAIIINIELIKNIKFIQFIDNIIKKKIKLEVYLKLDERNFKDIEEIVKFCVMKHIELCIIDIDKKNSKYKIKKMEYKKLIDNIQNMNKSSDIRLSIAECPYLRILNEESNNILGGCSGGITSCMINKSGNVILCYYLSEIIINNICKETLFNIWNNSPIFNKLRNRRNNVKGKCSKCQYILNCGGCRAESYYEFGDLFQEDKNCWL